MATIIRPFSFREFLRHRSEEPAEGPRRWTSAERSLVEKRFREYLVAGGFPETQGLAAALQIELLRGYVDTVLFRDVVERFAVSQVAALRWPVRQCLRNPAGHFSAHRLHQDLKAQGHGVAKDAVHALLGHLLDAFLLSAVPLATDSERQRNSNPRKLYPADPGLIKAFDTSGRSNVGHALETAVAERIGPARRRRGVRQDRRWARGGLPRAPAGRRRGAHPPLPGTIHVRGRACWSSTATPARWQASQGSRWCPPTNGSSRPPTTTPREADRSELTTCLVYAKRLVGHERVEPAVQSPGA